MKQTNHLRRIRIWLAVFMAGLVLSGFTAFPWRLKSRCSSPFSTGVFRIAAQSIGLLPWIERVSQALSVTNAQYPFLAYGTDWLAFAHLVIAVAFIGPFIAPVRNKWIITFGLIACAHVSLPGERDVGWRKHGHCMN
jgi:hypothetical protein